LLRAGIATPATAALMMQLGVDGVFVGSGIFKSEDPLKRAKAIRRGDHVHDSLRLLPKSPRDWEGDARLGYPDIPKDELLSAEAGSSAPDKTNTFSSGSSRCRVLLPSHGPRSSEVVLAARLVRTREDLDALTALCSRRESTTMTMPPRTHRVSNR